MCAVRIDRVLIHHVSHVRGHVQRLIATSMASGQLRKRGKGIDKKAKKLKIAYENPDCDTSVATVTAKSSSWAPKNWREQYDNIKKMREKFDAPVDTVGASKLADASALPKVKRYHILISLMLSSQTKDEVTGKAMKQLKESGLTVNKINSLSEEKVAQLIYPVGFWKRKAGYIKRVAEILLKDYDSDIPSTFEELVALPGVGPKMAHLVMDLAWGNVTGIAVDTHVHRISNRLGWVKKSTKNPEDTRKALEDWLPRSEWSDINCLLVGFGQQICLPVKPHCCDCLNKKICPAAKKIIGKASN